MHCRFCHAELLEKDQLPAEKCHQCQSWQNNRRYLDLSNLLLASLVSFIAVASIFITPLYELIKGKSAELQLSVLSSDDEELKILLHNSGNLPAGIKQVYLQIGTKDPMNVPIGKSQWGEELDKGSSKLLKLGRDNFVDLPVIADKQHIVYDDVDKVPCNLVIKYFDVGKTDTSTSSQTYACYTICPLKDLLEYKIFSHSA